VALYSYQPAQPARYCKLNERFIAVSLCLAHKIMVMMMMMTVYHNRRPVALSQN